jgi:hypothetical protein
VAKLELDGWVAKLELEGWVAKLELKGWVAKLELDGWVAKLELEEWVAKLELDGWAAKLEEGAAQLACSSPACYSSVVASNAPRNIKKFLLHYLLIYCTVA